MPSSRPNAFLILKVEERFEAGQASFEEVKNELQDRLTQPKMEGKVRTFLTQLREDAFLEIKEGYVDSGAAPGKDTRWKDVAQLKPQTTTKEEVRRTPQEAPPLGDSGRYREGNQARSKPGRPLPSTPPAAADKAPEKPADKPADVAAVPEKNEIALT